MKHVTLGTLDVARIGLGAMGMSHAYTGAGTDDESPRSTAGIGGVGTRVMKTSSSLSFVAIDGVP